MNCIFNGVSKDDLLEEFYAGEERPDEDEWPEFLELAEHYARWNRGQILTEADLSRLFDEEIAPAVIEKYGRHDQCAIDESFNAWTDMLCKDGVIHDEQYMEYTYVGKYRERS